MMADTAPSSTAASDAERQRRRRERRLQGVRVVSVELAPECLERLINEGWLSAREAQDTENIREAVADLLDCYGRRTLRPGVVRHA